MRNVIVTGASRGLGLGIAQSLAEAGYRVIGLARQETEELRLSKRRCEENRTGEIQFVAFDLGETEKLRTLVQGLRTQYGPIYGLVNNAAIGSSGVLANMHHRAIEATISQNIVSPIILTKFVVRSMMAQGDGRIINIASIIGSTGYSGLSVYAATKAAMIGFTKSLAREVGELDITVNAVSPGFLDTDMTKSLSAQHRAQITRRSALRRMAEIVDVAAAVTFLMGDSARNITGTVLTVDAGSTA
jgi:3-oxoacyl-[acyl-carrier protein] reductase